MVIDFTFKSGLIISERYPHNTGSIFIGWRIVVDGDYFIRLEFEDFGLYETDNCTLDYFQLFDGPAIDSDKEIGTWCWDNFTELMPNTFNSSNNSFYLLFRGHPDHSRKGFKAGYQAFLTTTTANTDSVSTEEDSLTITTEAHTISVADSTTTPSTDNSTERGGSSHTVIRTTTGSPSKHPFPEIDSSTTSSTDYSSELGETSPTVIGRTGSPSNNPFLEIAFLVPVSSGIFLFLLLCIVFCCFVACRRSKTDKDRSFRDATTENAREPANIESNSLNANAETSKTNIKSDPPISMKNEVICMNTFKNESSEGKPFTSIGKSDLPVPPNAIDSSSTKNAKSGVLYALPKENKRESEMMVNNAAYQSYDEDDSQENRPESFYYSSVNYAAIENEKLKQNGNMSDVIEGLELEMTPNIVYEGINDDTNGVYGENAPNYYTLETPYDESGREVGEKYDSLKIYEPV
ncbi:putative cubilin-like [Apostichopus japonicus]|uniref:Putative cubilin-like n=1 Tax=Stichopus japonicus TaxID=307972 RepID=A0A2G8JGB5_STIJA|nr:putative cubilin-like [Apostichopus japonicus]